MNSSGTIDWQIIILIAILFLGAFWLAYQSENSNEAH